MSGAGGLKHPDAPAVLSESMARAVEHKHAAQTPAWETLRDHARAVKRYSMANLPALLTRFEQEFSARGGRVLWAETAEQAADHFIEICERHGARSVVKGKSMVSEELDLNHRLAQAGIAAVETDLGEYIVQLAGRRPTHIIAPAIDLSRFDVGRLFARELGMPFTDDPAALSEAARLRLRARYFEAGVGMTGANFAIAETGTVVVVENEGNGGLSAMAPPVHVVVMGIEKVIPRLDDLPVFLHLLVRSATGQKLSAYVHHFLGATQGRTLYCIIVDAGRTRLFADEQQREALHCIRCGACLNVCPVYRRAGGAAYGSVYPGPIGSVVTPSMTANETGGNLPFASTLCGACGDECPVKIPLPHLLVHARRTAVAARAASSGAERSAIRAWTQAMRSARAYRRAIALARMAQPVFRAFPWIAPPLLAWSKERAMPRIARQTFKEWWQSR